MREGVPVPGHPDHAYSALSADWLERLVVRSLELRRNWTSSQPRVRREVTFSLYMTNSVSDAPRLPDVPPPPFGQLRCLVLYFLPGRGNKYLVVLLRRDHRTLRGPQAQRSYELQCWDIATPEEELQVVGDRNTILLSRCVARYSCTGLLSACVNADPEHPACLALTRHTDL